MNNNQMRNQIRRKKLGLLIRDAKLTMKRTEQECAQAMGMSVESYNRIEAGEIAPQLPQLESLACFLNIPLEHFWGKTAKSTEGYWDIETVKKRVENQNQHIANQLKRARQHFDMSLDELEEKTTIPVETLEAAEAGDHALPLPELETLLNHLHLEFSQLYDQQGILGEWHAMQSAKQVAENIPDELMEFFNQPGKQPYINLARQLGELPTDKLRAIAKNLLEITQ